VQRSAAKRHREAGLLGGACKVVRCGGGAGDELVEDVGDGVVMEGGGSGGGAGRRRAQTVVHARVRTVAEEEEDGLVGGAAGGGIAKEVEEAHVAAVNSAVSPHVGKDSGGSGGEVRRVRAREPGADGLDAAQVCVWVCV
jgi:hypothetical protein